MSAFGRVFLAEHLKLRRSLTGWAILLGGLFTPTIMLAVRLHQEARTTAMEASGTFWRRHWLESWESIAVLVLPLLLIVITTLVVQIEYRNNTWKQLHASPVPLLLIFGAKLAVLLLLVLEVLAVVNAGLLVAGSLPLRSVVGTWLPRDPLPVPELLRWNGRFLADALALVALQYALALRFRNVLVPLGLGGGAWVVGLVLMNTPYVAAVPHGYLGVDYLIVAGHRAAGSLIAPPPLLALAAAAAGIVAGFWAYARAADRGASA